jgi:hypothetical protein
VAQEPPINLKNSSTRRRRLIPLALVAAIAVTALFGAACSSDKDPTPTLSSPITFPYVLSGSFTVAGEPGPAGSQIFTRINGKQSGSVTEAPRDGAYGNLIAGANSTSDFGQPVTIHLGDPDGDSVQAEETFVFNAPGSAQFLTFDLTFPASP